MDIVGMISGSCPSDTSHFAREPMSMTTTTLTMWGTMGLSSSSGIGSVVQMCHTRSTRKGKQMETA